MFTTLLAYLLAIVGIVAVGTGVYSGWKLRGPRRAPTSIGLAASWLGLIGLAQALRLLMAILAQPAQVQGAAIPMGTSQTAPPSPECMEGRDAGLLLQKPFPKQGNAFTAVLPELEPLSDTSGTPTRSPFLLCENDRLLGPAHSSHDDVRKLGQGRFSHWGTGLYFSARDNSDPNTNGREYRLVRPADR